MDKRADTEDEEIGRINRRKFEEMLRARAQREKQTQESAQKPIILTDSTFSSEVSKHSVLVVDFWAAWCGPCRMVAPIMEELAKDYSGKVTFGKLNVDENPITANQFRVQSIPTILIFKNGQAVDGVLGAMPKAHFESKIRPYISKETYDASTPYS